MMKRRAARAVKYAESSSESGGDDDESSFEAQTVKGIVVEEMLHMVRPTLGYDNYAVTIYFTQVVHKIQKPYPIPKDWSIFV